MTEPWIVVSSLAAITVIGALALAALTARRRALAAALIAIFPLYLLVLAWSTETSSFAAIGARPENGGRFYGFQNQVETMLLVPGLLGAALAGRRLFIPVALLVLVTVGASFAGADGGGVLVFAAGYLFLWLRLRAVPLTARNLALAGAVVVGVARRPRRDRCRARRLEPRDTLARRGAAQRARRHGAPPVALRARARLLP